MKDIGKKCIKLYHLNLYFNLQGKYKNCCYQKKEYYQEFPKDADVTKSQFIKEVREYMELGKEHPSCSHCYEFEKLGIKSPRIIYNNHYVKKYQKNFPEKYSPLPHSLYFRFSNLCNFACRMCSSYSSTSRTKLDVALGHNHIGNVDFPHSVLEAIQSDNFLKNLDTVDIKGGEPFLHKQHFIFLQYLIKKGFSKNIELKYNSNLSILPGIKGNKNILPEGYDTIFSIWKHFKKITIRVSLEGYGKGNEYMRIGSSWKDIEKNIDTILSYEYINLSLTSTIQIDNLFLIPKLIIFAQSKKLFLSISAHSFVYEPEYLNIRILPQAIKKQVEVFYNRFLEKYNIDEKYQENLHNIIMYMNSGDTNPELLQEYIRVTEKTDELYNLDFSNKIFSQVYNTYSK